MKEKLAIWIAWRLPHDVVKWAMIRVVAHATTGQFGTDHVDNLGYHEFHDRWDTPHTR
jgi:hypothetical protein